MGVFIFAVVSILTAIQVTAIEMRWFNAFVFPTNNLATISKGNLNLGKLGTIRTLCWKDCLAHRPVAKELPSTNETTRSMFLNGHRPQENDLTVPTGSIKLRIPSHDHSLGLRKFRASFAASLSTWRRFDSKLSHSSMITSLLTPIPHAINSSTEEWGHKIKPLYTVPSSRFLYQVPDLVHDDFKKTSRLITGTNFQSETDAKGIASCFTIFNDLFMKDKTLLKRYWIIRSSNFQSFKRIPSKVSLDEMERSQSYIGVGETELKNPTSYALNTTRTLSSDSGREVAALCAVGAAVLFAAALVC
ncbi:BgTH12-02309 [Blumeria graminis f. sp. triticale]|uniref:BgTH12-02309 n=1 Tax=Blumeria graminis f. sp. triticale TaxID=1689686 RepID=A0A9W4D0V6_BLUGR|nr:BgTH12-02309 [Blumeria graminis f. sp. triticale]